MNECCRKFAEAKRKEIEQKDEAVKEAIDSMSIEFIRGAKAMLNNIRENVTGCYTRNDHCSVCISGQKLIKKLEANNK